MHGIELGDEELVRRIIDGEDFLFEVILNRYRDKVAGIIFSVTNSRDELDDIAQEVFISVYRNLRSFESRSRLSTWIYRITVNKCRDWQRRTYSRRPVELWGLLGTYRASPEKPPDVDEKEMVRKAVRGLPEKYRITIILYYYYDLSCQEISDILETPKKTVESRLMRGRRLLGKSLGIGGEAECTENRNLKIL